MRECILIMEFEVMRRMNYAEKKFQSPLVLVHDYYMDYEYYILNLGTLKNGQLKKWLNTHDM